MNRDYNCMCKIGYSLPSPSKFDLLYMLKPIYLCVYRVQKPTDGKITFNGTPLDELSYRESALQLAVVAQHNVYSFDFSVLEVVLMGRSPHKKMLERDNLNDYRIAREALATVGLADFEERSFATLSGGEQQRVILARALTQQTECLVLDEPTNHLDMKTKDILKQALLDFDGTLIVVSHDRDFLDGLVSKVYEFGNQKVTEHLEGIYEFMQRKKMENLRELERKN